MKNKKIIAGVLCAAVCTTSMAAFAAEAQETAKHDAAVLQPAAMRTHIGAFAVVKEVQEGSILVDLENKELGAALETVLIISEETYVIDHETGLAASVHDLKKDDKIFVYHSPASTRSLPPQTPTYVILTNVDENKSVAAFIDVEKVQDQAQGVSAYSADGEYIIHFTEDTAVSPYKTRNIVTYADITAGDQVLAWFDLVQESLPAQATAHKAVLLLDAQEPATEDDAEALENISVCEFIRLVVTQICGELPTLMDTHYAMPYMQKAKELGLIDGSKYETFETWNQKISRGEIKHLLNNAAAAGYELDIDACNDLLVRSIAVNGTELSGAEAAVRNGKIMLPLRDVCEALGFEVLWNGATSSAEINDGTVKSTIQIGFDNYFKASARAIGLTAPQQYGVAPALIDGKTYVPSAFFELLYSNPEAVSVENHILNIQK